jgi:hypothetical protein
MARLVQRDRVAIPAGQWRARLADPGRPESLVVAAGRRVRNPGSPDMPAMTTGLALRPDPRTERPDPDAETTMGSAAGMQHAMTVPRARAYRKDLAAGMESCENVEMLVSDDLADPTAAVGGCGARASPWRPRAGGTDLARSLERQVAEARGPGSCPCGSYQDRLRVEVTDGGPGFTTEFGERDLNTPDRYGLRIVDAEASNWGNDERGARVWFEVPRQPAAVTPR